MRLISITQLAVLAGVFVCGFAIGAETPDATAESTYALDTIGLPYPIKTQADLDTLWAATYRAGETVTLTTPAGTVSTLVSGAVSDGSAELPFDAGGLWTLENSEQGTAQFTVRHSIFGTLGDGTEESPAQIVDTLELFDLMFGGTAGNGYVFATVGADDLADNIIFPPGYGKESVGDTLWRLVAGADPNVFSSEIAAFPLDTEQSGPDRVTDNCPRKVAYSGDNWGAGTGTSSKLTVMPPGESSAAYDLYGTGEQTVKFLKAGDWTLTLESASGTLTSIVTVLPTGLLIYVH